MSRPNQERFDPIEASRPVKVEAIAARTNDAKVVVDILKFGVPKALINDQGTHFCNKAMSSLLEKYGVIHKIATPYHPQINSQPEENILNSTRDVSLPDCVRQSLSPASQDRTQSILGREEM
ncbi:hypothetical protein CR513_53971, partial [Mucuna pruriens]